MTSATDRRLQRVEAALYPTEAMALWLQEAKAEHRTLNELVASLRTQPDEAWPVFRLTHQAETGAKARLKGYASVFTGLKGQRAQFLERGGRDAVRDAAMLWFLFVHVNERFMGEQRAMWLLIALLYAQVGAWVYQDFRAMDEPLDGRIGSCLGELYGWQGTLSTLSERYFQGVTPLMSEGEERLALMVTEGEQLAVRFNDALEMETAARKGTRKRRPALPTPIDLEAVKQGAQPTAESHANLLVDMARAEACEMMGEKKQALAIVERHLRG
jgi:hypothetical protein